MTTRELFTMDLGDLSIVVGSLVAWALAFAAVLS